ncbi:hypothetical protein Tco_1535531, partial [Tanacetum coccineum]
GVTTGRHGEVLKQPEAGILFYNSNVELGFQRVGEYRLATTIQQLRMHNIIIQDTRFAKHVAAKLMLVIELRDGYFEAKNIVEKT